MAETRRRVSKKQVTDGDVAQKALALASMSIKRTGPGSVKTAPQGVAEVADNKDDLGQQQHGDDVRFVLFQGFYKRIMTRWEDIVPEFAADALTIADGRKYPRQQVSRAFERNEAELIQ